MQGSREGGNRSSTSTGTRQNRVGIAVRPRTQQMAFHGQARSYRVLPGEEGKRLDLYLLAQGCGLSRSQVLRLIREGHVALKHPPGESSVHSRRLEEGSDREILKPAYRVRVADEIFVSLPEPRPSAIRPEILPLSIVYEDGALIVVDKPQGMVVHPAPGHQGGTLVNALLPRIGGGSPLRPGVVHRLDKGTSGLIVFSKTEESYCNLAAQFKEHSVARVYHALVYGCPDRDAGTIDAPLGRHPVHRKKISVRKDSGRTAVTQFTVVEKFDNMTFMELRPETGRTHQIRVHLSYSGHPIAGDDLYGGRRQENRIKDPELRAMIQALPGPALHAGHVGFVHPETGRFLEFTSPLPEKFQEILTHLRQPLNSSPPPSREKGGPGA